MPGASMLVAFDNTDGPHGGCTTQVAFHVLLALPHLALTGLPRLVRLNPNIPWKTRGNAAVCLPLGVPEGPQVRVGELQGHEVLAFPEGRRPPPTPADLDAAWRAVQKASQPDAQPAVALVAEPPPQAAYWQGVQSLLDPQEARGLLDACGALWASHDSQRALPGCLAAAAWPGPPSSFELLAYREPPRWGQPRALDGGPLLGLDATGATFHTYDAVAGRLACVPRTPDPVLAGLRGRDPERLRDAGVRALALAAQEPVDGWLLWATNQASGDHVVPVQSLAEAPTLATLAIAATVAGMPESRHGGHVFVGLQSAAGEAFEAAAFEPTKGFRDAVRALRPGDQVVAVGAFEPAGTGLLKLEKLRVEALARHLVKGPAPLCPECGRSQKSAGQGQPMRCRPCGTSSPRAASLVGEPRQVATGWHEVPVIARRHLHRPLSFG